MIRVLVADDHPIVRQGLKKIMAEVPDIAVTGEAGSRREVLDNIKNNQFDVVLLDLVMPGAAGFSLLKDVKNARPNLAVLVLSRHPEEQYALEAIKAGASGYLAKTTVVDDLVGAIRKAAAGRKYISADLAETLADRLAGGVENELHDSLSDRERGVMTMIASGKSLTVIAVELSLSPTTVSTYRARILRKLNISNDAELLQYALQHDLLE